MNVERLTEIRDWLLEGAPERGVVKRFDMMHWSTPTKCGTVCCIGGTASLWYGEGRENDVESAGGLLGLNSSQSMRLFYAQSGVDLDSITPAHAARCITKLLETGVVDWIGTQCSS